MFKRDEKSLERISFALSEERIAHVRGSIEQLSEEGLLIMSSKEIKELIEDLNYIAKLKLNEKIYGFHVYDSWAEEETGRGTGVHLYSRRGDTLENFYGAGGGLNYVPLLDGKVIEHLKKNDKTIVYTGDIFKEFLGLRSIERDKADGNCIKTESLKDTEIEFFQSNGIKVVRLNPLV